MGFLDTLKKLIKDVASDNSTNGSSSNSSSSAASAKKTEKKQEPAKPENKSVTFTFGAIPKTLDELKALPEATLDTPFKTAALTLIALCNFENDYNATFEMIDFLNGPYELNPMTKQFYGERLSEKFYKTFSFFEGATPANNYTPNVPYKITISDNSYSYDDENWCTLYLSTSGADSKRPIKLRLKPSTNQWFISGNPGYLADIRIPVSQDPWA